MALVTPERCPSSVAVTVDTATFPLPSEARARLAVRFELVIVVAPQVIVACFPVNCVCIALVTPERCPSSASVTVDTATFPLASEVSARLAVRFELVIVVAPQVIVACFSVSSSLIAA